MPKQFSSHQFLKCYILCYTNSYLLGLAEYHDIQQLHAEIGKYLSNSSNTLNIKFIEKRESTNILGNIDNIAIWNKL